MIGDGATAKRSRDVDQRGEWRRIAANFYRTFCPDRMGEIDYIDFNYPVRDVRIEKGARRIVRLDTELHAQQPRDGAQHARVVVDHENCLTTRH